MLQVDRAHYCPGMAPYGDHPCSIGHNQTISAPHMHAHCLELLKDKLVPGANVLDVGCGSGYLVACMAHLVVSGKEVGRVTGIEVVPALVEKARANLAKDQPEMMHMENIVVQEGDGWQGCPAFAPFDLIHVGAAAATVPVALLEQLKPTGRLVIPVGPENGEQSLMQYDKRPDGSIEEVELFGVRYVPLVQSRE